MIKIISEPVEMPDLGKRRYQKKFIDTKWIVVDTHNDSVRYTGKFEDVAVACHSLNKKFYRDGV